METKKRVYSLDILKALAIVVIIFHHYQPFVKVTFDNLPNWSGGAFYWGYLVELFFVLSGYFTYKSASRIGSDRDAVQFFLKKYTRFLPLLLVCGVSYLLVRYAYCRYMGTTFQYGFWVIISSLLGVTKWFTTEAMLNNPTWYISVLLLCYVLFAAASLLFNKKGVSPAWAFFGFIVLGLIMRECFSGDNALPFLNDSIGRGLTCFFFGVLLFPVFQKLSQKKINILAAFGLLVVIAFGFVYAADPSHWVQAKDDLYITLVFIIVPCILLIFQSTPMIKLFSADTLKHVGPVAYSAFMWHISLLFIYVLALRAVGISFENPALMVVFAVICFAFGVLSSKVIEPVLRRLTDKLFS